MSTSKEAAEGLAKACNGSTREALDALVDTIVHEHRYIQGEVISVLTRALYRIGKENTGFDGRNEHAIKLCETLVRISDEGKVTQADINILRAWFF